MRLKNKKTGEIIETDHGFPISVPDGDLYGYKTYNELKRYNSLAELNEEWCDYEEPKEDGLYNIITLVEAYSSYDSVMYPKEIVEKLKAWQRLVNKGFRFDYVSGYENLCGNGFEIPITAIMPPEQYTDKAVAEDLNTCFGGEE